MRAALVALAVLLGGCKKDTAADGPCTCTPGNTIRTKGISDTAPLDGTTILARLRRHRDDVRAGRNPRDIKVQDDQLRFLVIEMCQPCGDWVSDRMTMEELFPMGCIDEAARATCMGLVLPDGRTEWGSARPQNCR